MRGAVLLVVGLAACGDPDAPAGPRRLSETGLYADPGARRVAEDLVEVEPRHQLWSDGALKRRWLRLPPGEVIDTSDPDRWRFPVGTQLFKEFSVAGVPVETRLIERVGDTGDDRADFWMGTFVWLPDGSDAVFAENGQLDINGTGHDAPAAFQCWTCHLGEPGHVLGVSAVQLRDSARTRLAGRFSDDVPATPAAADPALGYLHANCGHCHNPSGTSWSFTAIELRLRAGDARAEQTPIFLTSVDHNLDHFLFAGFDKRVVPGDPEASALLHRMASRAQTVAMPPLATEHADPAGLELVRAWILSLAPSPLP